MRTIWILNVINNKIINKIKKIKQPETIRKSYHTWGRATYLDQAPHCNDFRNTNGGAGRRRVGSLGSAEKFGTPAMGRSRVMGRRVSSPAWGWVNLFLGPTCRFIIYILFYVLLLLTYYFIVNLLLLFIYFNYLLIIYYYFIIYSYYLLLFGYFISTYFIYYLITCGSEVNHQLSCHLGVRFSTGIRGKINSQIVQLLCSFGNLNYNYNYNRAQFQIFICNGTS